MDIDTLFLSGCGTKGTAFIGSLNALIDKKILDIKNIKRYVCCSGSSIIGVLLCCGYSLNMISSLSVKLDYTTLLDLDDLDNIFSNQGLFANNNIGRMIDNIVFKKYKIKNISLKKFYELTNIHFICKVYNLSDKKEEYFSYENYPNLKVNLLVRMTTCIPFFFKPIKYSNKYYIDGGILCMMPFINKYKNYVGVHIHDEDKQKIEELELFEYITYFNNCLTKSCKTKIIDKRMIHVYTQFMPCINLDVCNNDKNIIKKSGYDQTIDHIKKFDLSNIKDNTINRKKMTTYVKPYTNEK